MHRATPLTFVLLAMAVAGCVGGPADEAASDEQVTSTGSDDELAWRSHPDAPFARTEVAVTGLRSGADQALLVLGGLPTTRVGSTEFWAYEPSDEQWTRLADYPVPIHHTAVVAMDRGGGSPAFACAFGGYNAIPFVATPGAFCIDDDVWVPVAPLPEPRGAHAAVVVDGEAILVGGNTLGNDQIGSVHIYNGTTDTWRTGAPIPTPREHLAAAAWDGKLYAVGGRQNTLSSNLATLEVYDPSNDTWAALPDAPTPRGGVTAAAYQGHIVLIGGEAPDATFAEVEAYDIERGVWETWPDLPTPRHGLGSGVLHDRLFVLLGGPEPGLTESAAVESLGAP